MTPGWEVYNRIVWDARLDADAFVIGYRDRHAPDGVLEMAASEWDPDGDVPWHRVRYFRCGETIVWDREQQIGLFAEEALPPEAWKA
jgi:poly(A) polymerase